MEKAAKALREIAGDEDGKILIRSSGVVGNSQEKTEELIKYLEKIGFKAESME